jgi:hypothetical protein
VDAPLPQRAGVGRVGRLPRSVVLARRQDQDGLYHREVQLRDDGSLVVIGHDLTRGEAFGEYEFERKVAAADVPALVAALGGRPGDDVLKLIDARWAGQGTRGLEELIKTHQVPNTFWNRIGD